jgi:hypothetical protein
VFSRVGREVPVRTEPLPTALSLALSLEQSSSSSSSFSFSICFVGVNRSAPVTPAAPVRTEPLPTALSIVLCLEHFEQLAFRTDKRQLTLTTTPLEAYCRAEADYGCVLGSILGAGIPDVLEVGLHSPPRRNGVVVSRLKNRLAAEAWIPL